MKSKSLLSPEGQSVTFVELFFDLVFVFAVTQIASLLHEDLDLTHVYQAIVIFWLIWWSWQQYTWTLNTIDTTNPLVELITLVATAIAFFMAIAIPEAFGDRAFLFAITYIVTRVIGLYLQYKVSGELGQSEIVKTWVYMSLIGLLSVLVGSLIGGNFQYVFWTLALVFDLLAAYSGSSGNWALHIDHMAERHGLIVIIALGESLIVAAAGLIDHSLNLDLMIIGGVAVTLTCGLWWSYFVNAKPFIEKGVESSSGPERAVLVRDAYSLAHFPMIAGVIAFAIALEEEIVRSIEHPDDAIHTETAIALALGIGLFIGGSAISVWRATRVIMYTRLVLLIIATILIISGILPVSEILLGLFFVLAIVIIEHVSPTKDTAKEAEII
ncbi:MAG: low temperature requirement protein A [Candidatus Kariarchaeaceae archaeon]